MSAAGDAGAPAEIDCLIVGGGPAGLTAAVYLARFHLDVLVADAGDSRAGLIPKTRNHAGFPEGISGPNLLRRMNQHARIYGARIVQEAISSLAREGDGFLATSAQGSYRARAVLLATGVTSNRPEMPDEMHGEAVARGLLRYCPICDGYEVTDQNVGVIGAGDHALDESIFLRSFTRDVTLIAPAGRHALDEPQRRRAAEAGIGLVDGPAADFQLGSGHIELATAQGRLRFATLYAALGSQIRSALGAQLGAAMSAEGCMQVDRHQRTSVAGLYAAGDVVQGLDQISHAMGEGGVAATAIRNDLAAIRPLLR